MTTGRTVNGLTHSDNSRSIRPCATEEKLRNQRREQNKEDKRLKRVGNANSVDSCMWTNAISLLSNASARCVRPSQIGNGRVPLGTASLCSGRRLARNPGASMYHSNSSRISTIRRALSVKVRAAFRKTSEDFCETWSLFGHCTSSPVYFCPNAHCAWHLNYEYPSEKLSIRENAVTARHNLRQKSGSSRMWEVGLA